MTPNQSPDAPHDGASRTRAPERGSIDVLGPLLAAAIFAYFGFFSGYSTDDGAGNIVPLFFAAVWGMRLASVLFLAAAAVAILGVNRAGLLAGILGGVGSAILAAITVWSMADSTKDIAVNHLIMIICVLWTAYSAFHAIRDDLR
jgi:hypothetical protein